MRTFSRHLERGYTRVMIEMEEPRIAMLWNKTADLRVGLMRGCMTEIRRRRLGMEGRPQMGCTIS